MAPQTSSTPGQSGPKRTDTKRESDYAEIARRYCEGEAQWVIARDLGLSQAQVSSDLKALRRRWRDESGQETAALCDRELARIDNLERTYWDAWHQSRTERKVTTRRLARGAPAAPGAAAPTVRDEAATSTVNREGNPTFLEGVRWCINRRIQLLGLDQPVRTEVSGKDGGPIEHRDVGLTDEQATQRIWTLLHTGADRLNGGRAGPPSDALSGGARGS